MYLFSAIIKILPIILQRMKIVGFLLAFYLILLSVIPCCALDNCTEDEPALSSPPEQKANQEKEDDSCDNCSPFFNCAGCATATIAFEPVSMEIIPIKTSSVYTGYIQTAVSEIEYDFWQPPRLG